jgi:cleavage and polyadenylation specificity factor subunit 2
MPRPLLQMGDYEVAWVDSEVGVPEKHEQTTEYGVVENSQMLPLLPIQGNTAPCHKAVYVGEVKLSDFRQVLADKGIPARFGNGALHCGKHVIVRKVSRCFGRFGSRNASDLVHHLSF